MILDKKPVSTFVPSPYIGIDDWFKALIIIIGISFSGIDKARNY